MLRWLKLSDAAAKIATSVGAGRPGGGVPFQVRGQRAVGHARRAGDAGQHRRAVGHLWHPLRADETRHLDVAEAAGVEQIDQRDLPRRRDRPRLVLQPVARAYLVDRDAITHPRGSSASSTAAVGHLRACRHQHLGDHPVPGRGRAHAPSSSPRAPPAPRRAPPPPRAAAASGLTSPGIGARISSPPGALARPREGVGHPEDLRLRALEDGDCRPGARRAEALRRPSMHGASSPSAQPVTATPRPSTRNRPGPQHLDRTSRDLPPPPAAPPRQRPPRARSRPEGRAPEQPGRRQRRDRQHIRRRRHGRGQRREVPLDQPGVDPPGGEILLPHQPREEPQVGDAARDARRVQRRAPAAPARSPASARGRSAWRSSGRTRARSRRPPAPRHRPARRRETRSAVSVPIAGKKPCAGSSA